LTDEVFGCIGAGAAAPDIGVEGFLAVTAAVTAGNLRDRARPDVRPAPV